MLLAAESHPPVVRVRRIPAEDFFEGAGSFPSLASRCVQREAIEGQKLAPFGLDVRAQRIVGAERHVGREGEDTGQDALELAATHPRRVFDDRAVVGHRRRIARVGLETRFDR